MSFNRGCLLFLWVTPWSIPGTVLSLFVSRSESVAALKKAMATSDEVFLLGLTNPAEENWRSNGFYDVGIMARVLQSVKLSDGGFKVLVEGLYRAVVDRSVRKRRYFYADVVQADDVVDAGSEQENSGIDWFIKKAVCSLCRRR